MGDRQVSLKCGDMEQKVASRTFDDDEVGLFCNGNSASMLSIWSMMIVTCVHADKTNTKYDNPRDKTVKLLGFWNDW